MSTRKLGYIRLRVGFLASRAQPIKPLWSSDIASRARPYGLSGPAPWVLGLGHVDPSVRDALVVEVILHMYISSCNTRNENPNCFLGFLTKNLGTFKYNIEIIV